MLTYLNYTFLVESRKNIYVWSPIRWLISRYSISDYFRVKSKIKSNQNITFWLEVSFLITSPHVNSLVLLDSLYGLYIPAHIYEESNATPIQGVVFNFDNIWILRKWCGLDDLKYRIGSDGFWTSLVNATVCQPVLVDCVSNIILRLIEYVK